MRKPLETDRDVDCMLTCMTIGAIIIFTLFA